jgi:N-acetylglucosamine-6-phosphate deacetylase
MSDTPLVLRNSRVVLPDRVAESATVFIKSGRISQLSLVPDVLSLDGREEDLQELTLFPGFIDLHIHGAVGVDTMDATADDLNRVSKFLVSQGVTGWVPTLVPASMDNYRSAVEGIHLAMIPESVGTNPGQAGSKQDKSQIGAQVLGVHYEGPFVNAAQCGALRPEHFRSYSSSADLDDLPVPPRSDAVKLMTLAPEVEGGIELVRELKRRGWIVSIGHTRAEVNVLDHALQAGARHLTHFMNAMPTLHHRSPGPVGWGLLHDDVTCDIIADGIHMDRLMLRLLLKTKTSDRLTLISDSIAAAGKGDGEYQIWEETIVVKDGKTSNSRGSIAGSVITMLDAATMMKSIGVGETDIARMTSTNPAKVLGLDHDFGSIEEGKRADLVALNGAGIVKLVVIGGEIVYDAR